MIPKELVTCYDALEKMKWNISATGEKIPTGLISTQWIHLQDCLLNGTVTKMECYDSIRLGYCPEHLKLRESKYKHLL